MDRHERHVDPVRVQRDGDHIVTASGRHERRQRHANGATRLHGRHRNHVRGAVAFHAREGRVVTTIHRPAPARAANVDGHAVDDDASVQQLQRIRQRDPHANVVRVGPAVVPNVHRDLDLPPRWRHHHTRRHQDRFRPYGISCRQRDASPIRESHLAGVRANLGNRGNDARLERDLRLPARFEPHDLVFDRAVTLHASAADGRRHDDADVGRRPVTFVRHDRAHAHGIGIDRLDEDAARRPIEHSAAEHGQAAGIRSEHGIRQMQRRTHGDLHTVGDRHANPCANHRDNVLTGRNRRHVDRRPVDLIETITERKRHTPGRARLRPEIARPKRYAHDIPGPRAARLDRQRMQNRFAHTPHAAHGARRTGAL